MLVMTDELRGSQLFLGAARVIERRGVRVEVSVGRVRLSRDMSTRDVEVANDRRPDADGLRVVFRG